MTVVDRVAGLARPGRLDRTGAVWLLAAAGAALGATYLAVRLPAVAALTLFGLVAIPVGLVRPAWLAVGLVPMSVVVGVYDRANELLLAGTLTLALGVLAGWLLASGHRDRTGPWLVGAGGLLLLLVASLTVGDRAGYGAPALPVDFPDIVIGVVLLGATLLRPPPPRVLAGVVALSGASCAAYLLATDSYVNDRLAGLTVNPNYLGALLAAALAAAAGLARTRPLGWLGPAAVILAGLVQTHSRGALVAALVGVTVALISGRPLRWRLAGLAGAGLAIAVLFSVANVVPEVTFGDRTEAQLSANNAVRADAVRVAVDIALAHPLRGIGFGLFPYAAQTDPRLGVYINTHNDYLKLAAEAGLVTLVVFAALLVAGLTAAARPGLVPVRAAVAAGAVTLLFVNALSNEVVGVGFWVCLGCLLAFRARPAPAAGPSRPEGEVPWLTA